MQQILKSPESELPDEEPRRLRDKAAQCRRMAQGIADRYTANALQSLAEEYERDADHSAARSISLRPVGTGAQPLR